MSNVGLLYVGAVLFVNGLMLVGKVDPKAAALLNLFVGGLQVITPTAVVLTSGGDTRTILSASGLYLFGFTYLYVGIGLLAGLDTTGVGYFSLFVSVMALGYSYANFVILKDLPFGIIWLYWSFLWGLFFVLLGLKKEKIKNYTGWVTAVEGWVTGAIPAFMLLAGYWNHPTEITIALIVFAVVVFAALWPLTRRWGPAAAASRPGSATIAGPG